jgi:hypothetical protein
MDRASMCRSVDVRRSREMGVKCPPDPSPDPSPDPLRIQAKKN